MALLAREQNAILPKQYEQITNEKTHIFPVAHGVDYLGWHFYLTDTGKVVKRLWVQNKKKLKRRMKGLQQGYAAGRLEMAVIARSIAATHEHLSHGHTYKLRKRIYSDTVFARGETAE